MARTNELTASIVINNHNYGRFLAASIDSALRQTYQSQVVVVDDASTDASRTIMTAFDGRITPVYHEDNRGQGEALNSGIAHADGDVVILLDADDMAKVNRAERLVDTFASDPDLDWIRHDMTEIDEYDRQLRDPKYGFGAEEALLLGMIRYGRVLGSTSGLAFRRTFLTKKVGRIPASYRDSADWYLMLAARLGGEGATIRESLTLRRMHSDQMKRHQSNPEHAAAQLAQLGRVAHDAQELALRSGSAPEVAKASTWWQLKAEFGLLKTQAEHGPWREVWLSCCWSLTRSDLPLGRKAAELARCVILGVVPVRCTLTV